MMQFWILQIETRFMIKREAFSNKIKQLTWSCLYAHFSVLQTKISKIVQPQEAIEKSIWLKPNPKFAVICKVIKCVFHQSPYRNYDSFIFCGGCHLYTNLFPFKCSTRSSRIGTFVGVWSIQETMYIFSWTLSNQSLKEFDKKGNFMDGFKVACWCWM